MIMRKMVLDDEGTGVKIGGRTISNLWFTDDTVLLEENKKDQSKSIMKLKAEREKMWLSLKIKKTKIMTNAGMKVHIKINNEKIMVVVW